MVSIKIKIICFFVTFFSITSFIAHADSSTLLPSVVVQSADYVLPEPVITKNTDGTTTTTAYTYPGPSLQNMKPYISSYPASAITADSDGNYTQSQIWTTRQSSSALPSGLPSKNIGFLKFQGAKPPSDTEMTVTFSDNNGNNSTINQSLVVPTSTGTVIAPSSGTLFNISSLSNKTVQAAALDNADNATTSLSTISSQFDTLINTISENPDFIQFFRKIHLNILNELYEYLMNIYTNFNLIHPGSTSTNGSLTISIPNYLSDQETYATNIKTLIVNHLINLIEEQFNSSVQAVMPSVPKFFATKVGKTTVLSDYSVDLTRFIVQDLSSDLSDLQSSYLNALQQYLTFFQNYTSLISVTDESTGFSTYCSVAEHINTQLTTTDMGTMLTKMNPAMFFYDTDTMRALRVIPNLAKKLPAGTASIGWPTTMTNAAANRSIITVSGSTHPVAYFTTANGSITTVEAQAEHLYAVIQNGANYFREELLKQPDWLNSEEGILKILRACLGDFTALIGMDVLDCCMETLIKNGLNASLASSDSIATSCQNLISSWSSSSTSSTTTTTTENTTPAMPAMPGMPGMSGMPTPPTA